ncbi:carbonic anhydrase [Pseudomassariella vexata]|uniref:Carbonic anhydrase n=1 Tax=Pseudomassariella vexata TaxID=1141098 RepID=A0A1Y2EIS8_9PEZI|nr:carbonic anhydrase [Pseudomassariella vexata]ORY71460.1 carbonic anhydrase [Pseudomassariella vexata]
MKFQSLISFLVPTASAMCDHGTSHFYKRNPLNSRAQGTFSHQGATGPIIWHTLANVNSACALGTAQSPINVKASNSKEVAGSSLTFAVDTYPEGAELENLGTALQVPANGTLTLKNTNYSLAQFHFHTPSEHLINDEYYPLEVHFVWEAADSSLAVVGFLIEVARTSDELLTSIFANVADITGAGDITHTESLNFTALATHLSKSTVFQYSGSLTTPPCTEGISWNIVSEPISIDVATYVKVKGIMKFNSRYIQDINGEKNLLQSAMAGIQALTG